MNRKQNSVYSPDDFLHLISNLDYPHQKHNYLNKKPEVVHRCVVVVEGHNSYLLTSSKGQGSCEGNHLQGIADSEYAARRKKCNE